MALRQVLPEILCLRRGGQNYVYEAMCWPLVILIIKLSSSAKAEDLGQKWARGGHRATFGEPTRESRSLI